jgi:Icc-related predicted phosphoesterase
MRLAWVNDIHLNFVNPAGVRAFTGALASSGADAVLLGGDIGEAPSVVRYLRTLAETVRKPIYFVLGNHDFYHSSIALVRQRVSQLVREVPSLIWLTESSVVPLSAQVGLVGHDGWADGRCGDFFSSTVPLSDYQLIADFLGLGRADRFRKLNELGDEAAAHFRRQLPAALEHFHKVIVVTHVPPYLEAAVHEGKPSDANYAPHFACRAAGEALSEAMAARRDREMLVLCGHTHGEGRVKILPNLEVLTGGAVYGRPAIHSVIEV